MEAQATVQRVDSRRVRTLQQSNGRMSQLTSLFKRLRAICKSYAKTWPMVGHSCRRTGLNRAQNLTVVVRATQWMQLHGCPISRSSNKSRSFLRLRMLNGLLPLTQCLHQTKSEMIHKENRLARWSNRISSAAKRLWLALLECSRAFFSARYPARWS